MDEMTFKVKCLSEILKELAPNLTPETQREVMTAVMDLNFQYHVEDGQVKGPVFKFRGAKVDPNA